VSVNELIPRVTAVFNSHTYSTVTRVVDSCSYDTHGCTCAFMTHYTTLDAMIEIGTSSTTVEKEVFPNCRKVKYVI